MGPVCNPDRPQGRQNLLEAFANFKRRNQWISLKVSNEIQGAAEKSGPLNFFAVFSATVWDFNTKFSSFIY